MNYFWSFPGGTPSTSNASSPVVLYPNAGNYTAQLIVTNSCGGDTITFNNISVGCVGMEEYDASVSAFYNSAQHELMLQLPVTTGNRMMIVRNSVGQDVFARSLNGVSGPVQVALPSVAAGVYYLMVTAGDEKFVMKFVVE
jgi:PKD repeat protein